MSRNTRLIAFWMQMLLHWCASRLKRRITMRRAALHHTRLRPMPPPTQMVAAVVLRRSSLFSIPTTTRNRPLRWRIPKPLNPYTHRRTDP